MFYLLTFLTLFIPSSLTYGHQPVMDIAPRNKAGIGVQVWQEYYGSSKLLDGEKEIENGSKLKTHINKTWYEGVWSFNGEKRLTVKLPYVQQSRVKNLAERVSKQVNNGFADLEIGLPLRTYRQIDHYREYISITPNLRLPTGSDAGDFPLSDGSTDFGLSLSYNGDSPLFYQFYDIFFWKNNQGAREMREGNEFGADINWGYRLSHHQPSNGGVFAMWDITARHNDSPNIATLTDATGGTTIHAGPMVMFYKKNLVFRLEYKYPFYEKRYGISLSHGDQINVGVGAVF